jgi:hypothetical protein
MCHIMRFSTWFWHTLRRTSHFGDLLVHFLRILLGTFSLERYISTLEEICRETRSYEAAKTCLSLTRFLALSLNFVTILCCCFRTTNSQVLYAHSFDG